MTIDTIGALSLVDTAEEAVRNWLASGRRRAGDRLPPEHDLAGMLGVSRGTLRRALYRLEERGEIVRRQGSGTFVGEVARPILTQGLERLESYSSLARRRGLSLDQAELRIERKEAGEDLARIFDIPVGTVAPNISRTLLVNGRPSLVTRDVVHPSTPLPTDAELERAFAGGQTVLDVLVGLGEPISFASTVILPALIGPDDEVGRSLRMSGPTAVLELQETTHLASGEAIQRSRDIFAPGGLDLQVIRWLEAETPAGVGSI